MSWFFNSIPYLLAAGTVTLGLFTLWKEWDEYKNARLRMAAVCVLILVGGLTFVSLYRDNKEKQEAEKNTKDLEGQVKAANDAQTNNTKLFVQSFQDLSNQLTDLKTQAKTAALQKKISDLQTELQNNEKALAPGPKAELTFTFVPFTNPPARESVVPSTEVTLPSNLDGSVHVEFSVLNLTTVDAVDGELTLQLCDQCKFAKEPPEFVKMAGETDLQRHQYFQRIFAEGALHTMSADVIVPTSISNFPIGIIYRCRTCVIPKEPSKGIVHILGRIP